MARTLDLMVDMDDVFFPLIDNIHRIAHEKGLHDNSEPANNWYGWKQYGCSEEAYWDLWADFTLADGYLVTPPIEGAAEALRWLQWNGHRIHIVTARGFMANAEEIREWTPVYLEEFAIPHTSLTFAQDKASAMHQLGVFFDSAVDDSPRNYEALDNAGVRVYLHDHPHNATAPIPPERRVPNLWEWAYRLEKEHVDV